MSDPRLPDRPSAPAVGTEGQPRLVMTRGGDWSRWILVLLCGIVCVGNAVGFIRSGVLTVSPYGDLDSLLFQGFGNNGLRRA